MYLGITSSTTAALMLHQSVLKESVFLFMPNTTNEFKAISGRLALLKLRCKYNNISLIQCYAPTESRPDEESEKFYADLQALIDSTSKRDNLFVMGDFNAKIGNLHLTEPEVVGPYNNIIRGNNERGKTLISFCKQNRLVVANSLFKHRNKFTWISPGDRIRNTINFIMVRKSALHHDPV